MGGDNGEKGAHKGAQLLDRISTVAVPAAAAGIMATQCDASAIAVAGAAMAFNLAVILAKSTQTDHADRMCRLKFILMNWGRDVLITGSRYFILSQSRLTSMAFLSLLWPLGVFETWSTQWTADQYEKRPILSVSWEQITKQFPVACAESFGLTLAVTLLWHVTEGGPSAASMLHSIWRAPLFDLGLDIGFYTFHRACHVNRKLYRWVHAEHHTDTGKEHGHLVAHETFSLSLVETFAILGSYLVGFVLLGRMGAFLRFMGFAVAPLTFFDVALLVTWAHSVELLGHTTLSWTPPGHPMRFIVETAGVELHGTEHTMHHLKPLSNFSKRLNLLDKLFGTYTPPSDMPSIKDFRFEPPWETGRSCRQRHERLFGEVWFGH